jgi:glycogen operon protein
MEDGVNFAVHSRNSTHMELLLFDGPEDPQPSKVIQFDPVLNHTYHYWHIFVPHVKAGQVYAYRARGEYDPERGLRFDPDKVLLDPYGRAVVVPKTYDRGKACKRGDNCAHAMRNAVTDVAEYQWENDDHPRTPWSKTVIYEMHVAGFTKNPNSAVAAEKRGTYAGVIEKIPYLVDLGITAVELLPVFHFDVFDAPLGRINYWGYSPVSFFAPHPFYSSRKDVLGALDEFRDMVKAFHKAGIEVILDVVFNHTAEGNDEGPTLCYKGLSNREYYMLEPQRQWYSNYSGCGNTLNANNPIVRRMIVDSLRYWVTEMHVDGFRFDLASILSRDQDGRPLANPPVLWDIETDPALAGTKLIAEAWDAAGLYQVGNFIGDSWKEWNGRFRDDVRSFVKSDSGKVGRLASRLLASPDIYEHEKREPEQSINFVTCHDGFTLNDLVSYNEKHNEANGENNNDGDNHNRSWNCGAEGPTDDPAVDQLRLRQIKNFFTLTLYALGTPMILMGDEVRHTQDGNNNAFCQDNELSWFDWSLVDKNAELLRFVQQLIKRRLNRPRLPDEEALPLAEVLRTCKIRWHGVRLDSPDWSHDSHSIAFTMLGSKGENLFHMMINAYWEPLQFELPPDRRRWVRSVDTALQPPHDITDTDDGETLEGDNYVVQPRSIVVLRVHREEHAPLTGAV